MFDGGSLRGATAAWLLESQAAVVRTCRASALAEDALEIDLDLDVLGDQEATGLQGDVPGDPQVLAVDLRLGGEDGPLTAPKVADVAQGRCGPLRRLI